MGKPYATSAGIARVLLFKGKFYRSSVIIPDCFTLERKGIVSAVERPWAYALDRMLADRRLKKTDLAELAGVRPGTISAVANSPKAPDVATLQRLADGLTKHDRSENLQAPAVALWEFFVSDEQAALLHQSAQSQQRLVKQEELTSLVIRQLAPAVAQAVAAAVAGQPAPQQATQPQTSSLGSPTSVEEPARGRLQRRKHA